MQRNIYDTRMRLYRNLSSYSGNLKLSQRSSKYLQTVFNISFFHENEEITGDFLTHEPAKLSRAVIDEVGSSVTNFVKRHGFNTKNDLDRVTGPSSFSATIRNLTMERHKLLGNFVAAHLLVDDIFDLSPTLQQPDRCSPQYVDMVCRMNRFLSQYIRCNVLPIDKDIRAAFPRFEDGCRMYYETGAKLLEYGHGLEPLEHVYRGFDSLVGGNVTQAKLGRPKSKEEYLERKSFNFGFVFYFELCCLLAGEGSLSEEVRESAVFQKFRKCLAIIGTLTIDPMSVLYDESQGLKDDNYTLILTKQGSSAKDAVKATIILYNRLFVESLVFLSQLDAMNISVKDQRILHLYYYVVRASLGFPTQNVLYNRNNKLKHEDIDDKDRAEKCVLDALHALPNIDDLIIAYNKNEFESNREEELVGGSRRACDKICE